MVLSFRKRLGALNMVLRERGRIHQDEAHVGDEQSLDLREHVEATLQFLRVRFLPNKISLSARSGSRKA